MLGARRWPPLRAAEGGGGICRGGGGGRSSTSAEGVWRGPHVGWEPSGAHTGGGGGKGALSVGEAHAELCSGPCVRGGRGRWRRGGGG